MSEKIAVVTGGSSGLGRCACQALSQAGYRVYELSRRDDPPQGARHVYCDLTDERTVREAIDEIIAREGRIDLVINNAGAGISGAVEFTNVDEAQRLLDLNLFGAVRVNQAVLPCLRRQGGGRIVHISSVAAVAPLPFQAYYSAGKAALNAYSLALANEVRPFGIEVCAVQPGDVRTGFTAARRKLHRGDDAYAGRISRSVARMEKDEKTGMPPERVAAFLLRLLSRRRLPPVATVGLSYQAAALLLRLLPMRLSQWLLYQIYGR